MISFSSALKSTLFEFSGFPELGPALELEVPGFCFTWKFNVLKIDQSFFVLFRSQYSLILIIAFFINLYDPKCACFFFNFSKIYVFNDLSSNPLGGKIVLEKCEPSPQLIWPPKHSSVSSLSSSRHRAPLGWGVSENFRVSLKK